MKMKINFNSIELTVEATDLASYFSIVSIKDSKNNELIYYFERMEYVKEVFQLCKLQEELDIIKEYELIKEAITLKTTTPENIIKYLLEFPKEIVLNLVKKQVEGSKQKNN